MTEYADITLPFTIRKYELVEKVGEGGFSQVYKAYFAELPEAVAVKVISKARIPTKEEHERLMNEVNVMQKLKHDSIVSFIEFFEDGDSYYLVMEYCGGGTLFDYIVNNGKLKEQAAASVFYQLLSAVKHCHGLGISHRDLKNSNILVSEFPRIKISDFGLSGWINPDEKMKTFCGSPSYAAPECLNRVQYDGIKADMWSLGVILYEMVTGDHPWTVSNMPLMLSQIRKVQYTIPSFVSDACSDIIRTCMKLRPSDRPTTEKLLSHPWMKLASSRITKALTVPRARSFTPGKIVRPGTPKSRGHRNSLPMNHSHSGPIFNDVSPRTSMRSPIGAMQMSRGELKKPSPRAIPPIPKPAA